MFASFLHHIMHIHTSVHNITDTHAHITKQPNLHHICAAPAFAFIHEYLAGQIIRLLSGDIANERETWYRDEEARAPNIFEYIYAKMFIQCFLLSERRRTVASPLRGYFFVLFRFFFVFFVVYDGVCCSDACTKNVRLATKFADFLRQKLV